MPVCHWPPHTQYRFDRQAYSALPTGCQPGDVRRLSETVGCFLPPDRVGALEFLSHLSMHLAQPSEYVFDPSGNGLLSQSRQVTVPVET